MDITKEFLFQKQYLNGKFDFILCGFDCSVSRGLGRGGGRGGGGSGGGGWGGVGWGQCLSGVIITGTCHCH